MKKIILCSLVLCAIVVLCSCDTAFKKTIEEDNTNENKLESEVLSNTERISTLINLLEEAQLSINNLANKISELEAKISELEVKPEEEITEEIIETEDDGDYIIHTVAAGETLWDIAVKYYSDGGMYATIIEVNGLTEEIIRSGDKLKIPIGNPDSE